VVFRKQYYARAVFDDLLKLKLRKLMLHTGENFKRKGEDWRQEMTRADDRWTFGIKGTGFEATLGLTVKVVPERGRVFGA